MSEFKDFKTITENAHKRIECFFDAVIAIAITMMALEISLPDFSAFDKTAFITLMSELTVYFISFVALAGIWGTHAILYSTYQTLGGVGYILSNVILMFLVSIFPVLTKMLNQFQSSYVLRCIYIGDYLLMEIVIAVMLIFANYKNSTERKARLSNIRNAVDLSEILKDSTERTENTSIKSTDEIRKKLAIAEKYFSDKEISEKLFQELIISLPEQFREQYYQKQLQYHSNRTKMVFFLIIIFSAVSASVAVLMVNPFLCYFIFGVGLLIGLIGNFTIDNYYKKER